MAKEKYNQDMKDVDNQISKKEWTLRNSIETKLGENIRIRKSLKNPRSLERQMLKLPLHLRHHLSCWRTQGKN